MKIPTPEDPPSRRSLLKTSLTAGPLAAVGLGAACQSAGASGASGDAPAAQDDRARLDELFADLEDQRGTVDPIRMDERAARRQRLGELLAAAKIDALLMEGGPTMTYLSGVSWGHSERLFGLIVLADGNHFWICPGFEAERAKLRTEGTAEEPGPGGEIVTWQEHEYPFAPLASALAARGVERLGVEPSLRHRFVAGLQELVGQDKIVAATDVVVELRGRKDERELALLRRANELTQQAIVAANEHIRPGMRGSDISALVRAAQERLGLRRVWDLSLVGPASAYPHGGARQRELQRGDVILIDTGGSLHEYQSDNTRSWVFDAPVPQRVENVWNVVRDAQKHAYEGIRPGRPCKDIDAIARERIALGGFGSGYETFTHRLGHGIGMQGHEDPYFDGGSEVILAEGMTFSDEPGIYLYGEFGIRIEDIVAVTADGADHFGDWQASPASPA